MNFKKTVAIATAVGALTAISVPAMALENEFHGMFRNFFYLSNALSGGGGFMMKDGAGTSRYAEQRARIQYTAKASDDLKLVTHFELDSRWGGNDVAAGGNADKYGTSNDAGKLDADGISLETKNVYLDFNCPITGSNVKAGIQPFSDAYQGTFGNWDGAGLQVSKKFSALTGTAAWFRAADTNVKNATDYKKSADIYVLDGKFALGKDLTLGANYYAVSRDTGTNGTGATATALSANSVVAEFTNMLGLNAAAKVGPAAVTASLGYQFGDFNATRDLKAFGATATAKIDLGVGKVNASALYLSGNKNTTGDYKGWQTAAAGVTYFNASNMWLLIRNGATINSSTSVSGADIANKGLGMIGGFAGFEGALDKIFYSANIGYAEVAEKGAAKSASLGTEVNATVGYKLYSNLSASLTGAYLVLGDGLKQDVAANTLAGFGAGAKADNPFLTNVQLNYTF